MLFRILMEHPIIRQKKSVRLFLKEIGHKQLPQRRMLHNVQLILKRAVGHTPKSKTLDEVYLHPKATQMIEAFDKANQLVNDEVLTTTKA